MLFIRTENNGIRYFSFQEIPGFKKPKEKKNKEEFGKCKACGEPLVLIEDTNVYVCNNPKCKGIFSKKQDKHYPSYRLYDDEILPKGKKGKIEKNN